MVKVYLNGGLSKQKAETISIKRVSGDAFSNSILVSHPAPADAEEFVDGGMPVVALSARTSLSPFPLIGVIYPPLTTKSPGSHNAFVEASSPGPTDSELV